MAHSMSLILYALLLFFKKVKNLLVLVRSEIFKTSWSWPGPGPIGPFGPWIPEFESEF